MLMWRNESRLCGIRSEDFRLQISSIFPHRRRLYPDSSDWMEEDHRVDQIPISEWIIWTSIVFYRTDKIIAGTWMRLRYKRKFLESYWISELYKRRNLKRVGVNVKAILKKRISLNCAVAILRIHDVRSFSLVYIARVALCQQGCQPTPVDSAAFLTINFLPKPASLCCVYFTLAYGTSRKKKKKKDWDKAFTSEMLVLFK